MVVGEIYEFGPQVAVRLHDHADCLGHYDDHAAEAQSLVLREVGRDGHDGRDVGDIQRDPEVVRDLDGDFGDEDNEEEGEDEGDPGHKDGPASHEESVESEHVEYLSLLHVAVVEERAGEDDEAGHHHVVDGAEVADFEHEGQQALPEDEDLLGALLVGFVGLGAQLLLGGTRGVDELAAELLQGGLDLAVQLALCLKQVHVDGALGHIQMIITIIRQVTNGFRLSSERVK